MTEYCFHLPVKPGMIIYYIDAGKLCSTRIEAVVLLPDSWKAKIPNGGDWTHRRYILSDEWGRTAFATLAEAEEVFGRA